MRSFFSLILIFLSILFYANAEYNREVKVEPVLKTDITSLGQKIDYPQTDHDEVTIAKVTLPPGKSTGWHKHLFPVFAYILKGTLTVEFKNGETKQFPENSSFAEVIDMSHNGKNNGKEDVVLLAFFMGEKGKGLSVKE